MDRQTEDRLTNITIVQKEELVNHLESKLPECFRIYNREDIRKVVDELLLMIAAFRASNIWIDNKGTTKL